MGRRIPKRAVAALVLVATALLATACSSGPVRRISQPAASIQQLAVEADGSWAIRLRLQNYSSIPMRFDSVELHLEVDGQAAGTLAGEPALEIGPASADVLDLRLQPASGARMQLADALAAGRRVDYVLDGSILAGPADRGSARSYPVDRTSALNPTPGLPGVLR